jgi:hypothetical protein
MARNTSSLNARIRYSKIDCRRYTIDVPPQSRAATRAPKETRPNEAGTRPAAPAFFVSDGLLPLEPDVEDGLDPSVGEDPSVGVDPPVLDASSLGVELGVRTTVVDGPTLMMNEEFP